MTQRRASIDRSGPVGSASGRLTSPMPGTVLAVYVRAGESVHAGQALVVVEAMKMEHIVTAPHDGSVAELLVRAGESVRLDQPLLVVTGAGPQP